MAAGLLATQRRSSRGRSTRPTSGPSTRLEDSTRCSRGSTTHTSVTTLTRLSGRQQSSATRPRVDDWAHFSSRIRSDRCSCSSRRLPRRPEGHQSVQSLIAQRQARRCSTAHPSQSGRCARSTCRSRTDGRRGPAPPRAGDRSLLEYAGNDATSFRGHAFASDPRGACV
jgi:hypothetical protein